MKTKKSKKADLEQKRPLFFLTSLVLSLGFVFAAFSWKTPVKKSIELKPVAWDTPEEIIIPSTEHEKKEVAPPPTIIDEIVLVDDNSIVDEMPDFIDLEASDEGIDYKALMNLRNYDKDEEEEIIHTFVDEMPEFPGGIPALLSFIGKTLKYPVIAQETGIQGKVFVNFVINKNGEVSDAKIMRSVDQALDQEALRVVNKLPRWKPGKQSGRPVRVSYVVPINFVLQ